jgi:hypothetical protein
MPSAKAEVGGYNPTGGLASGNFSIPSGLAVGDPLFLVIGAAGPVALSSVPSGWTLLGGANIGTGGWLFLKRNGGWQTADGTSLALTFTTTIVITYSTFAFDKTLYSPDTFTQGSVTTRATSITTTTAASVTDAGSDKLVISIEKAASHTGAPTAPGVSPATTQVSWRATSTASTPSVYVGIYSGSSAARTITYTTASSNGAAFQVALTVPGITRTAGKQGVIASDAETMDGAVLRGVIASGSEVAAGAVLRGVISGGVEVAL